MDKRFRSLTIIVCILVCTVIASAAVVVCYTEISAPLTAVILGLLVLGSAFLLYLLFSAIVKEEKTYHGADYAAMIDSITGGVLVLDGNDRVYTVSDDARGYLDLPDYAVGMAKDEAVKDQELLRCIEAAKQGESNLTEYKAHGKVLRVLVDPVIFSGQIVGTMLLLLDMGEQLTLQNMVREFTANVSHELKTPLTSISGYAEMIASGLAKPEDVKDFASRIQNESKRMLALISDIIRLSRLDNGGADEDAEPVDMAELADECRDVLLNSANSHGVTLDIEAEPLIVNGSRSLLTELVYNLMDNAIRYNKEGGSVTVRVTNNKLSVEDTGIDIPEEHRDRVFERFYRVDKSRSKQTGGTGLGLAIVKSIAERYGAHLSLESEVGKGTKITVEFPKE